MRYTQPASGSASVAVVDFDVTTKDLAAMHAAGVRGVRYNFLKRLVDTTPRESYRRITDKIASLGWHIVVYFESPELEELAPFIESLSTTVVVDHMGRPDVKLGTDHPQWKRFLRLMDGPPNIWVKVSGPEPAFRDGATVRRRRTLRPGAVKRYSGPGALGNGLAASQHGNAHARRRKTGRFHPANCDDCRACT